MNQDSWKVFYWKSGNVSDICPIIWKQGCTWSNLRFVPSLPSGHELLSRALTLQWSAFLSDSQRLVFPSKEVHTFTRVCTAFRCLRHSSCHCATCSYPSSPSRLPSRRLSLSLSQNSTMAINLSRKVPAAGCFMYMADTLRPQVGRFIASIAVSIVHDTPSVPMCLGGLRNSSTLPLRVLRLWRDSGDGQRPVVMRSTHVYRSTNQLS